MPFCTKCGRQINAGEQCSCMQANSGAGQYNQNFGNNAEQYNAQQFRNETERYVRYATNEVKGSVVSSVNEWKSEIKNTDAYERNISIVPDTLKPNEGEVPIKQYDHVAKLRSREVLTWAEGKMQVTSKRLIFRAPGRNLLAGKQVLQHEFDVNDVAGVEFKKNFRFVPLDVLFAMIICSFGFSITSFIFARSAFMDFSAIFIILGLVAGAALTLPLFMLKGFHPYIKLLCFSGAVGSFMPLVTWLASTGGIGAVLAIAIVVVLLAVLFIRICKVVLQPNLQIVIRTKSGIGAVTVRHMPIIAGFGGGIVNFSGFNEVLPDVDTEKAVRELGAVIADVQAMGDKAAEKWN